MSAEYTNISTAGRKRSRRDYDGRQTPNRDDDILYGIGDPVSPQPFVNTKYIIKGGLDTPGLAAAQLHESATSEYSDIGYRRELSGTKSGLLGEDPGGYESFLPLDLDNNTMEESVHQSRQLSSPGEGWSKVALEVVGGVVGKVWEFCKNGAFRGFHAGGGKGFTVNNPKSAHYTIEETDANFWSGGDEKITTAWGDERDSTPLPGQFPVEDFIPDYMDNLTPAATPERPGKRRQISSSDELTRSWVVVPSGNTPVKPAPQPRALPRFSLPTTASSSRRSIAPRPASRASNPVPRRPLLQRVSHAGSPSLNHLSGASFASPRSPGGKIPRATRTGSPASPTKTTESPAAKEAMRWAQKKKQEEREADVTIRRLDAQMKAMIREAKEALGTKVEVDVVDDKPAMGARGSIKKWGV